MLKFFAGIAENLENIPVPIEDFSDLEGSTSKVLLTFLSTFIVAFIGHRTKIELAKIQRSEDNTNKKQQILNGQREENRRLALEKEALSKRNAFLSNKLTRIHFRCEAALQATLLNYIPPNSQDRVFAELKQLEDYNIDRLIDNIQEQERIINLMRETFTKIQGDVSDGANS